jgi:hypothetical protein
MIFLSVVKENKIVAETPMTTNIFLKFEIKISESVKVA